jgi:hemerythrin-like domain-containing protein
MTRENNDDERRRFLGTVVSGAALALTGCGTARSGCPDTTPSKREKEGISPGEDLMREHGVLERILLVYDECARRLEGDAPVPPEALGKIAGIVRRFMEDYHERLEEQFLFPRFEAAKRETELVRILREQHARGRELTVRIVQLGHAGGGAASSERLPLTQALRTFVRMYRPHAAREDTVLFPAFAELVGASAYRELGEAFEEREHALFGEHGFADVVKEVASIEQTLGIHDLGGFTPTGAE